LELETNTFVNSNQNFKQMDLQNSKEDLSNFFSKFDFESVWIFGKELHPGFSLRPRRKEGDIRAVGWAGPGGKMGQAKRISGQWERKGKRKKTKRK
jgi:hypothetical protein